jgi:hypothetical protein
MRAAVHSLHEDRHQGEQGQSDPMAIEQDDHRHVSTARSDMR